VADLTGVENWAGVLSFKPTKVLEWVLNSPCRITCLFTGNQAGKCLTKNSFVETPQGEKTVLDLYQAGKPFEVYAWVGNEKVIAPAEAPFKKEGIHKCYRITMSDGRWVEAADHHRILSTSGDYVSVLDILSPISGANPKLFNSHITNIEPIQDQEVYDFTVPDYHNYFAAGLVHHNTDTLAMDYVFRVLGMHPNKYKNMKEDSGIRTFRFASQSLPSEASEAEVKNTQYPAFKRRFPLNLVEKDITIRRPVLTVRCPHGDNVNIEFISYSQDTQATAGTQRASAWFDEEPGKDMFEEQVPRLLATDGDIMFTFTPVPGSIGWEYDDLYERARIIYRTEAVRDRIKKRFGDDLPEVEITDSSDDICIIMAATDDNPIYEELAQHKSKVTGKEITSKEYIDSMFAMFDDEDVVDARRYGLFRQLSGKVYKSFTPSVHVVRSAHYFPDGIPLNWKFARGLDHHESNPWAIVWIAISPTDEIFVWEDYSAKTNNVTYDIAHNIALQSLDYKYALDLIDPNAAKKQNSTNLSTIDDLNRYFKDFKNRNIGSGAHWQSWETHGTRGREEMTKRILNSVRVGKPFNNKVVIDGAARYLPTIWVTDNCKNTIESMKNWRYDEWGSRESEMKNDPKERPMMKFSHFPLALECLLKSPVVTKAHFGSYDSSSPQPKRYAARR